MRTSSILIAAAAACCTAAPAATPPAAAKPSAALQLTATGFTVGANAAKFDVTPRAQAVALATAALGKPTEASSHGDCGQGAVIAFVTFRGKFELSFVKGRLSGWTADGPAPRTAKGIAVGATLAALRKAYPNVATDPGDEANGGLGPSFTIEPGPNGWIDGTRPTAKVTGLWAGTTCLAGV